MTMAAPRNPDHALIRRFLAQPAQPLALDSNPLAAELNTRLHAWNSEDRLLTLRFSPGMRQLQGNGVVQGGLVTAMLDFGLAFCVLASIAPPRTAVTASLHTHFERAVLPGELEVRAKVDRVGSRLAFTTAQLTRAGDFEVLARATATLAVVG